MNLPKLSSLHLAVSFEGALTNQPYKSKHDRPPLRFFLVTNVANVLGQQEVEREEIANMAPAISEWLPPFPLLARGTAANDTELDDDGLQIFQLWCYFSYFHRFSTNHFPRFFFLFITFNFLISDFSLHVTC